ncbi:MAG: hypothetical protein K0S58_738 [Nitrospira sp.]|jgi:hypothetical protein|nr:hypothetical protein [Nitrospira sp.]
MVGSASLFVKQGFAGAVPHCAYLVPTPFSQGGILCGLHCAHRAEHIPIVLARLDSPSLSPRGDALVTLSLRASNEGLPYNLTLEV